LDQFHSIIALIVKIGLGVQERFYVRFMIETPKNWPHKMSHHSERMVVYDV